MAKNSTMTAIRFGYGLGPERTPQSVADMLDNLTQPDEIATRYPVKSTADVLAQAREFRTASKRAKKSTAASDKAEKNVLRQTASLALAHGMARILDSGAAFRERLVWFWADHFTAVAKNLPMRAAAPAYIDEAIRPHVGARFGDMLTAVVTHPMMLLYLDQASSVGPNSRVGKRRGAGLNENLARELMELHTLGVGSAYTQADVRQMAELLTGLTVSPKTGFFFNPRMAEPGAETVLGQSYGGDRAGFQAIRNVLDDLAIHPATARHLARKLAVHFVSDSPDQALIDHMSARYSESGGDLMALYQAMLEHPSAWVDLGQKVKQPFDFIASSLVALNMSGAELLALSQRRKAQLVARPMAAMGQPFMEARGPDGWPEAAQSWITPQGLASRIDWATGLARKVERRVRDPATFMDSTLADAAGPKLVWAIGQVSGARDGIALVLASAEFNRR
jgi:uncharacterized protein (DUF1800 family)